MQIKDIFTLLTDIKIFRLDSDEKHSNNIHKLISAECTTDNIQKLKDYMDSFNRNRWLRKTNVLTKNTN